MGNLELFRPEPLGLRYYQQDCVDSVVNGLSDSYDSGLVVMPTGTGKTVMFCEVAKRWPGRVLILAHREELIDQAVGALERHTGLPVDIEKAAQRASIHAQYVVGSIQTVFRDKRLKKFQPGDFSLVIVDEAHRAVAKSYRKVIDHFTKGGAKVLGVTATPDRGDQQALGQVFEEVLFEMDISDAIEDGWLVPPKNCQRIALEEVDLDKVQTTAGDFQQGQLDEEMQKGVEAAVKTIREFRGNRQVIAFTPGVQTAHYLAERLNYFEPGSAESVDGEMPREQRKRIVRKFREGQVQYLCNCNVFTEGFDAPTASVVAQLRPTKSRSLYAQTIGRVTRVLPGLVDDLPGREQASMRKFLIEYSDKPHFTILDFVGNSRHPLVGPVDALGGKFTDEEVVRAKELAGESGEYDPQSALKLAREEIKKEAARIQRESRIKAKQKQFDPFNVMGVERRDTDQRWGRRPLTQKQRDYLLTKGLTEAHVDELSKREATQLIDSFISRQKEGLATYKQLRILKKNGVDDPRVGFKKASEALDYIFACPKGRVNGEYVKSIIYGK